MIGFIHGKLVEKQPPYLTIDVNGVGYEIQTSMNTFYKLPEVGVLIKLLTHLIVREDAHLLYGFSEARERELFRTLIKVNGVGPKLALTILSSMAPDEFVGCISVNDTASLVRMPGVGKKTAERLVIEMRDKLAHWQDQGITYSETKQLSGTISTITQDAVSALIALGYKPQEASRSVNKLADSALSCEELIKLALQQM
ncbi:MAG: Holliday junction DNA helicase RuvA [Gammaproteobacteria bacterium RIFCSPHIGHO2_12_FULL_35_23]|nr:MAG: Holliday junction DNA helicase RuvA [Gammaproteobacteria bacterium RIFCSPHIGHO2_12_FULL_35_23]